MALMSLAKRLQSDRVGTGLVSPSAPSFAGGGGLAAKLKNAMRGMHQSQGPLRQRLTGQARQKPSIRPVGASPIAQATSAMGAETPGIANPLLNPQGPQLGAPAPMPAPMPGVPGAPGAPGVGGDLRARLLSLLQANQPVMA